MAFEDYLDMMPHEITIEPHTGNNAFGAPTYGSAVTYRALVQQKVNLVRDLSNRERASNTKVFVGTVDSIDARSRMTLPTGFLPSQPPIIRVDRPSDERGIHHTVIFA